MQEATQKKGMSKGCLIGLIVAVVLVVIIIIVGVVLWMNKEDVVKFGATAIMSSIQQQFVQDPPPGIDSAGFVNVMTAFNDRFRTEPVDAEKLAALIQKTQTIPSDSKVDSVEADLLLQAIFEYYPDLEDLYVPVEIPEMLDSTMEAEPSGEEM